VFLDADHRAHAVVENGIRDLKYGVGLDHLPSGRFGANAAWLAFNVIAHNLARWTSRLGANPAGPNHAPAPDPDTGEITEPTGTLVATDTLRRRHLAIPGRLTCSARKLTLHLPSRWPWADTFNNSLANLRSVVAVT